jgi:hypothetical protein
MRDQGRRPSEKDLRKCRRVDTAFCCMSRIVAAYANNLAGSWNERQVLDVTERDARAIEIRGFVLHFSKSAVCQYLHNAPGDRDNNVVLPNTNLLATVVTKSN